MSGARGIAAAGAIALFVTSAHAFFRFWPVTRGTEIYVPAALFSQPAGLPLVSVQLSFARIELDVPHTTPPVTETFERVRRIGGWWISGGDAKANARKRRGRPLYLQLTTGSPLWPGGPVEMRPATVSDSIVGGAVNLEGVVTRVREDGYLWLDFAFSPIAVPRDVAAHARPPAIPGPSGSVTGPIPRAADPGVSAVLRVLPSGRAALVGVIVNGTRH